MDATKSVKVSFNLKDDDGNVKPFTDPEDPPNMVMSRRFYDHSSSSRWLLYLFDSEEHQKDFILNQPERFHKAIVSTPKQAFYDHWCSGKYSAIHRWY